MQLLTGTSGYSYKGWKGVFYPEDLPDRKMLEFYAQRFPTVEINNTFYRLPSEKLLRGWIEQVPESFCFVLKASRRITHFGRLKNIEEPLGYLLQNVAVLGERLGPLFFQLPPTMKKNVERLRDLLALVPGELQVAVEFRSDTWYDDEVYDTLRASNAALCIADTDEDSCPRVATADWGYLRLRRASYEEGQLEEWARFVQAQAWARAFTFFKHEDRGGATVLARKFEAMF
jgi:uncharacterized protein YecE (DUF72 family)